MRRGSGEPLQVPGLDDAFMERLVALRRRLAAHPEPAFEEQETARIVASFLQENAGLEPVATEIAGHGLLYRIAGEADGPSLLLRADLDGLELQDAGRRHACGHDGHLAMLAGALALAAREPGRLVGPVHALFQPAEETGQGAARVLDDPRVRDLQVDAALALHNLPGWPLGQVRVRSGAMACASVGVHFRFRGEVSHAAEPHRGRSAVPAIAALALRAPAVATAVTGFGASVLVTPIHLEAGRIAFGTSAGSGSARFTVRAADAEDLKRLVERLHREAKGLADAHGLQLEVEEVEPFPATTNAAAPTRRLRTAARAAGLDLAEPAQPMPWSEDFGHITAHWPGALAGLGSGADQPDLHRAEYEFPDALLAPGLRFWWAVMTASDEDAGGDET